jgi:hypothetical protein
MSNKIEKKNRENKLEKNWEKKRKNFEQKYKKNEKGLHGNTDSCVFVSVMYHTFPKYIILRVQCIVLLGKYTYVKIHHLVLKDEYNMITCNCEL